MSLDNHMVKGRGENRGKYLRAGWGAKKGRSPWVRKQRKAARIDKGHAGKMARELDGYVVLLTCPASIDIGGLKAFIREHAAGATDALPAHWVHGAGSLEHGVEEATDFCRDCCQTKVDEILEKHPEEEDEVCVDGGWGVEHDSPPRCETCGAKLSGSLTSYGAEEELEAITDYAAPAFNDADGWDSLNDAVEQLDDKDPWWRKIARIVDAAKIEEQKAADAAIALAAMPGMTEARAGLVSLLAARAVQKAPDPSFRLWDEIATYEALVLSQEVMVRHVRRSFDALEKRLVKEARIFADCFGFRSHWSGRLFMIDRDGPGGGGGYHWPFVVKIEQYRMWNPPAFQEGRAYMLHPCPSGNPKWPRDRDANPYPAKSEEHTQWDCGYIGSMKDRGER